MPFELDSVAFPALVIADDGWVERVFTRDRLSAWRRSAILKYNKRRIVLYDSRDRVWRIEGILPLKPLTRLDRLLAYTFYNPKVPVRARLEPITGGGAQAVQEVLEAAINADDDLLTQWTPASELREAVRAAGTYETLVRVLEEKRAI